MIRERLYGEAVSVFYPRRKETECKLTTWQAILHASVKPVTVTNLLDTLTEKGFFESDIKSGVICLDKTELNLNLSNWTVQDTGKTPFQTEMSLGFEVPVEHSECEEE